MLRKILFVTMLGIGLALFAGCAPASANTKLFTPKTVATVNLEEARTFYKNMDVHGPILGKASPGQYEVLEAVNAEKDQGVWVKIEDKGVTGYVLGFFVLDQ
jgi:hypothetical protein